MKFFQNKKKKAINKLAEKIIRRVKKEESSREAEKNRPSTISVNLVSKCCGARVEYSKNYVLGALMGEEHFRCTACGKDPCWVEEIIEGGEE